MDGVDVISRSLTVFDLPYLQLTELSVSVAVTLDCRLFVYQEKTEKVELRRSLFQRSQLLGNPGLILGLCTVPLGWG